MKYRLLALDMDGTTLNSEKKIPAEILEAINGLLKRGVQVVLSTGRGLAELSDYREDLKDMRYSILISGGMVYDFRKQAPVYVKPIPLEDTLRVIASGETEQAMVHLLTIRNSIVKRDDIAHMENFSMKIYQDMYERVCDCSDDLAGYAKEHAEEIVKINLYHRSVESMDRSFERLRGLDLTMVRAEKTGLEASPSGITKARGLEILCGHLGIPLEQTAAVGDAPNDLEVLQTAGLSAAMGNAIDEVKQVCDVVVADNDHNGVLEVIQKFF